MIPSNVPQKKAKLEATKEQTTTGTSSTTLQSSNQEILDRARQQLENRMKEGKKDLDRSVVEGKPYNSQNDNVSISYGVGTRQSQQDHFSIYASPSSMPDDASCTEGFKRMFTALAKNLPSSIESGSTATICLVEDKRIVTAHLGDTRAIKIDNNGKVNVLTVDHTLNEVSEFKRIQSIYGNVNFRTTARGDKQLILPNSSVSFLAMTRSFGDNIFAPYGKISEPDVTIVPRSAGDTVVLASDGLWDTVSEQDVKDQIMMTRSSEDHEKINLSKILREQAQRKGSGDNITVISATEPGLYMIFDGHGSSKIACHLAKEAIKEFCNAFDIKPEQQPKLQTDSIGCNLELSNTNSSHSLHEARLSSFSPLFDTGTRGFTWSQGSSGFAASGSNVTSNNTDDLEYDEVSSTEIANFFSMD